MTDTRRQFIKKATLLTGSAGLFSVLPGSIQKALAINADQGTTYLDAEHIVFLMQENRSFDHCYGTLQGVRGFDDPRAMRMPDLNTVWLQRNKKNETYIPFNLDIRNTKATWMHSLPHSWHDQVDAYNKGAMDGWLESKRSGNKDYGQMPLTMGYYDRKDIPFYYALADAFTVCDQNFCSSLTGTSSNRSYFWAGSIREEQHPGSKALVYNDQINFKDLTCTTFPERLEEAGVSWKVYQNEVSIDTGLTGEQDDWLGNFTDNNLEFYKRYNIRLHKGHVEYVQKRIVELVRELEDLKKRTQDNKVAVQIKKADDELVRLKREQAELAKRSFDQLSEQEKSLHQRAFVTNANDPHYRELTTFSYREGGEEKQVTIPKGDVLYQFRQDVNNGQLPTVSWLCAPSNFSDHPTSPWYGAWYVSEVLDILTRNPEVWKKTIFILNYDENDGYFDHVAPFVPPNTNKPESGKCSPGLDTSIEHVTLDPNAAHNMTYERESPIGLGFRVPMVIASPWTRGGWVNSEVFDHTSCLRFLETFIAHKKGKAVKETNISDWRRTVCGDLTSVFRPYNGEPISYPASLKLNDTVQRIHEARNKPLPNNYASLSDDEVIRANNDPRSLNIFPRQEKGMRRSCALPYELYATAEMNRQQKELTMVMRSGPKAGVPFNVMGYGLTEAAAPFGKGMRTWAFTIKPGDQLTYHWPLANFEQGRYQLELSGPNGFWRSFSGNAHDPALHVEMVYIATGNAELKITNRSKDMPYEVNVAANAYHTGDHTLTVAPGRQHILLVDLQKSHHWYDLTLKVNGYDDFGRGFAGRVETGKHSYTDPQIGA